MGLIFGPDPFTVAGDTNIDAYPSGDPDYTYAIGSGANMLVNAANDWVVPQDSASVNAVVNVTDTAISASLGSQEVRAVVSASAAQLFGSAAGVTCMMTSGGIGYLGSLFLATNEVDLTEVTAGPNFTTLASADRGLVGATNYSIALRCVANAQQLIINGETEVTASDATNTTGRPGLYGYDGGVEGSNTPGKIDDFEVDDLSTGIWLVGVGAQTTGSTAASSLTSAFPAGYSAVTGDFGLVFVIGRPEDTALQAGSSGWTEITAARSLQEIGANDLRIQAFYRNLQSGDSAPAWAIPATWDGTAAGMGVQMAVWRGVDTTTPLDTTAIPSSGAAAATFTPTGITTLTANAHVVVAVASGDDNALRMSTFQNFTAWMGGASYDATASVGDFAFGMGSKQQVTPGAVTAPTWTQMAVGNDAWVGVAIALRPIGPKPSGPFIIRQAVNRAATY